MIAGSSCWGVGSWNPGVDIVADNVSFGSNCRVPVFVANRRYDGEEGVEIAVVCRRMMFADSVDCRPLFVE